MFCISTHKILSGRTDIDFCSESIDAGLKNHLIDSSMFYS